MAAIAAPYKITWGSQAVGGADGTFQIEDQYTFHKSYEGLDLQFVVTVVATSYADLDNQSNTLEEAFRDRDKTLKIDLSNILDPDGASTQTYTWGIGGAVGSGGFLNSKSTIDKIGEDDEGFSRSYAIHITGDLPGQDVDGSGNFTGLQDIKYDLDYSPSQQKTLTITGIYTATPAQTSPARDAKGSRENYEDATTGADVEVQAYFTNSFPNESWEIISETPDEDRVNHLTNFTRVYREMLFAQSATVTGGATDPKSRNDPSIADHTFTMDEIIDEPGDSLKEITRLREVEIFYECAVLIDQNRTLKDTFEERVRPHIIKTFKDTFTPSQIAVARRRVKYDETRMRLSASMTIMYYKGGTSKIVEIETSVRNTDTIHHKFTPRHDRDEFAFNVDRGWTDRIRTTTTQTVVIGEQSAQGRVGGKGGGMLGGETGGGIPGGGTGESQTGWVDIYKDSDATSIWVGMEGEDQFLITKVNDVKIEQFFNA